METQPEEAQQNNSHPFAVTIAVVLFSTLCFLNLQKFLWLQRQKRKKMALNPEAAEFRPSEYFTRGHNAEEDKTFPQLLALGEDLVAHILSFVADAPLEDPTKPPLPDDAETTTTLSPSKLTPIAFMTHSLPYVSKLFHRLMKETESYWTDALLRQVSKEYLWQKGLKELLPPEMQQQIQLVLPGEIKRKEKEDTSESGTDTTATTTTTTTTTTTINALELVERAKASLGVGSKALYQQILNSKIRSILPIFYMGYVKAQCV